MAEDPRLEEAAKYVMRLLGDAKWHRTSPAIKERYYDHVKEILHLCGVELPTTDA